jgi:spore coat protein U-like protein
MNRHRLLTAAAVVVAIVGIATFGTPRLIAGTASANLAVTASVSANCLITAGSLAFGAYDPVSANASTDLSGSGTFTVACTKNAASVWVGMGLGNNVSGSTRRMQLGATGTYLTYELYKDNTASPAVWGNTQVTGLAYTPTSKAAYTMTVYGKVPSNQDVPPGSYTDTVQMTVNF